LPACGAQKDLPPLTADYMQVLHKMNPDGQLRYYPGSPELARRLTRPQDRVLLNEKHPEDGVLLKDNMKGDRRVSGAFGRRLACAAGLAASGGKARA
jgi:23S rRNA (adenine2030-N6)-methyltransferase